MKTTVLITGGSGLIGQTLSKKLSERGYRVHILSRKSVQHELFTQFYWDINKQEIDPDALKSTDIIIHLAGANIGEKRWTKNRKKEIVDSRILSTNLLYNKLKESDHKPKVFISSSAVGYYGAITSDKIFTEADKPENDFLGQTCLLWEQAVERMVELGIRTVKFRTGIVLSKHGGALDKLTLPIKTGFGSALGNGNQFMPWIHIDDLCNLYIEAIENSYYSGSYNAVAPSYVTNTEFVHNIAQILDKPLWIPNIPAVLLKIILGEMSEMVLYGSRVSPKKLEDAGFQFIYPRLNEALTEVLLTQKLKLK